MATCRMNSFRSWVGAIAAGLVLMTPGTALAQWYPRERFTGIVTSSPAPNDFSLYYFYWAPDRSLYNYEYQNVPWRIDVNVFGGAHLGQYYECGPHMIDRYPGGPEAFYSAYFATIDTFFARNQPDPNNSLIALDFESWGPWWTGHPNTPSTQAYDAPDFDWIDDWRDHIRDSRPQLLVGKTPDEQEEVFRQTYLAFTREFFTRVFNYVKAIRPNAKIGFYNVPVQMYWQWRNPAQAAKMRWAYDNELGWFWDMVDVILPSVYPFYNSLPNETPSPLPRYSDRYADFEGYLTANIQEALRHAKGKPVIPFISYQFHPSNQVAPNMPVNEWMMRRSFEIPRELGCSGVVAWGWALEQSWHDALVPFYRDTLNPFVRQFSQLPSLAMELNPPRLSAPNAPVSSSPDQPPTTSSPSAPAPAQTTPAPAAPPVPPEFLNSGGGSSGALPQTPQDGLFGGGGPGVMPDPSKLLTDQPASAGAGNAAPSAPTRQGKMAHTGKAASAPKPKPDGIQSIGPIVAAPADWTSPPIVISSSGPVLKSPTSEYASAVSRALAEAKSGTTSDPRSPVMVNGVRKPVLDPFAAAIARQNEGRRAALQKALETSKPAEQVITTVPTDP